MYNMLLEKIIEPARNLIFIFQEDYKLFLARVLATHAPSKTLCSGSSQMENRRTLQEPSFAHSLKSCKTLNKESQKTVFI